MIQGVIFSIQVLIQFFLRGYFNFTMFWDFVILINFAMFTWIGFKKLFPYKKVGEGK